MIIDWNMVSAVANCVMAATAVIAAWYALRQYRASIKLHELDQILRMYSSTTDVMNQIEQNWNHERMREALNVLELHERLISYKLLSVRAITFYRDAISINEDVSDIADPNLTIIRDVLSSDKRGYRHLIAALKGSKHTDYIINW